MKIWRLKKNGGKRKNLIMTSLIRRRKLTQKKSTKLQRKWQNWKNSRKRQRKKQKKRAMRLKKLSMRRKKQFKISKKVKPSLKLRVKKLISLLKNFNMLLLLTGQRWNHLKKNSMKRWSKRKKIEKNIIKNYRRKTLHNKIRKNSQNLSR